MGRKPRIERTAEEKWQILQEGLKRETSPRRVVGKGSRKRCSIAGRMKRSKGR